MKEYKFINNQIERIEIYDESNKSVGLKETQRSEFQVVLRSTMLYV